MIYFSRCENDIRFLTEGTEKKGGYIMSDEFFNQDGTGNVTDQTSDTGAYNAPEAQAYNAPEPQTYSAPEPDVQPETESVQQDTEIGRAHV